MAGMTRDRSSELQWVIANRRMAEQVETCALMAFSPDELAAMPDEQRTVLDVLIKRYLTQHGETPELADCLRLRQQFEQFCDGHSSTAASFRVAAQLR